LNDETFIENLVRDGYVVLPGCVSESKIALCQQAITSVLGEQLREIGVEPQGNIYADFLEAIKHFRQFDIQMKLTNHLKHEGLQSELLREPAVLEKLIVTLGPDLEYQTDAEMLVNVRGVQDPYLVKRLHQEYWSGCGLNTLQAWTPLALEPGMGGLEVIEGSHIWGHIPHRNREPLEIPGDVEYKQLDVQQGDMIIFHSLLVHASVPNKHELPRFAFPQYVRNFHDKDSGFEDLKSWDNLHYSPLSQIRKRLGNPHLSAFRTHGSERVAYFRQ